MIRTRAIILWDIDHSFLFRTLGGERGTDVVGNFAYSISINYFMGIETLLGHGEKEIRTESKCWEATSEARNRPVRVFVQTSMGLFLLETIKKYPGLCCFQLFLADT